MARNIKKDEINYNKQLDSFSRKYNFRGGSYLNLFSSTFL